VSFCFDAFILVEKKEKKRYNRATHRETRYIRIVVEHDRYKAELEYHLTRV